MIILETIEPFYDNGDDYLCGHVTCDFCWEPAYAPEKNGQDWYRLDTGEVTCSECIPEIEDVS